jgi:hypothetical protein
LFGQNVGKEYMNQANSDKLRIDPDARRAPDVVMHYGALVTPAAAQFISEQMPAPTIADLPDYTSVQTMHHGALIRHAAAETTL